MTWLVALVVFVLVLGGIFAWGLLRLRRGYADAATLIAGVREEDVPVLLEECLEAYRSRLDRELDLADVENTAAALDQILAQTGSQAKMVFAAAEHPWRFVLPLGACLGELIRRHSAARWVSTEAGGLALEIEHAQGTMTTYPFDKVLKQTLSGDPGDLIAYVQVAINPPEVPED